MQSSELEQDPLKNTASTILYKFLQFLWRPKLQSRDKLSRNVILLVLLKNLVGGLAGAQTFDFPLGRLVLIQQSLRVNGIDFWVILGNKPLWTHLFIAFYP